MPGADTARRRVNGLFIPASAFSTAKELGPLASDLREFIRPTK